MSSQKKVAIAEDSFNNQTSQSNQQEIDKAKVEEAKNKIISLEPTKKQRDIFCKEVLPNTEIKAREHNILFTGLTKLFKRTIELQKQEKQIQNEDIKDYITKSTQVKLLIEKLEDFKSRNPNDFGPTNFNLRSIYFNMTGKNLMIGLFYSIAQSLLSCGCVFIMDKITDMLKDYNGESSQKRDVCLLLLAISIGYIIKNVFYSRYAWYQAKFQANTYATLQYLVFSKSLRTQVMSASSSNEDGKGSGDGSDENPDANNIMTVDVDQQQYIFWAFVQTVQSIVTIAVVLYLIYYRIGSSIYNGLYILLASFCFNIIVTQLMRFFYTKLYKQKDARVSLSKDVIDGMKSIKYLGWEEIFKQKIEKIRSKEFRYIIITRILDGVLSIFWNCVSYFLLFFFLVSYVNDGHDLKDSNVFTIIALFGLLTGPIGLLPWSFGYLVKARVSYRRIKKFLNEKEINHNNVINLDLEFKQKTTNNSTDPNSLIESFQDNQSQNSVNNVAICIRKMKFDWPTKKSSKQIKMEEKEKKKQQKSQNKKGDTAQESLLGNQFENSSEIKENNKFQLKVLDLTVQKGDLAIIIGKIGSGKSALLQAILNELEMTSMDLQESLIASKIESSVLQEKLTNYEKKIIVNGKTGYVSQNHWLQNKTIKENILFGKEYDPFWYNECIESCDLKVDFSTFSKKDEKVIGPGGGNLSGGQRQRIAICRALYQNCDIYLFDDIFSSLDAHVAEKVYQQVIVDVLVKKYKKTVLLVTSHFSIFSKREYINKIFYLQKGSIVYEQQEIEDFIKSGLSKEQEEEEAKKQKQKLEIHVTSDDQLDKEEEDQEYDQIEELNELEDQEIQQLAIQKKSLQKSRSSQIEDEVVIRKKQSSKNQAIYKKKKPTKKQKGIKFRNFIQKNHIKKGKK